MDHEHENNSRLRRQREREREKFQQELICGTQSLFVDVYRASLL